MKRSTQSLFRLRSIPIPYVYGSDGLRKRGLTESTKYRWNGIAHRGYRKGQPGLSPGHTGCIRSRCRFSYHVFIFLSASYNVRTASNSSVNRDDERRQLSKRITANNTLANDEDGLLYDDREEVRRGQLPTAASVAPRPPTASLGGRKSSDCVAEFTGLRKVFFDRLADPILAGSGPKLVLRRLSGDHP